jgi:hypothetical protein
MSNEPGPRFRKPGTIERWFNRLFGAVVGAGIGPSYVYQLEVTGRKSGRTYSTPVSIVDRNGKRFLVAPRGETQWVRNAGGNPLYTEYKGVGHEVWLKTFKEPDLVEWVFAQHK